MFEEISSKTFKAVYLNYPDCTIIIIGPDGKCLVKHGVIWKTMEFHISEIDKNLDRLLIYCNNDIIKEMKKLSTMYKKEQN